MPRPKNTTCIVDGCDRVPHGAYCAMHRSRIYNNGGPGEPESRRRVEPFTAEFFWSRVTKTDGCWEWARSRLPCGYGTVGISRRICRTHRVAWELTNGPIPSGMHVLHHCDNPPCCRPEHLFLGTHADNMADMSSKGRGVGCLVRGEAHHSTRLADATVSEIRAATGTHGDIGARFGVSRSYVHALRSNARRPTADVAVQAAFAGIRSATR